MTSTFNPRRAVRKVRKRIAVCATSTTPLRELTCHYVITQCYLPPGTGDIPAFTPSLKECRLKRQERKQTDDRTLRIDFLSRLTRSVMKTRLICIVNQYITYEGAYGQVF